MPAYYGHTTGYAGRARFRTSPYERIASNIDRMTTFTCPVVTVTVEPHPNADRLEVARVGGYQLVVAKGAFRSGDTACYLPEGSVLPASLIEELGLVGRLAGSKSNRVKAVRLRGVLSQGLLVALDSPHVHTNPTLGDDLAEQLGVVKWEPPIPVRMQGIVEACTWPSGFDVESWQAHPDLFNVGEPVQVTEKLHGTFCLIGYHPYHGEAAASKSMAGKTRFKLDAPENDFNLYVRAWRTHSDAIRAWSANHGIDLQILGEIVGPKVQDLTYGFTKPTFLAFDVKVSGKFLSPTQAWEMLNSLDIPTVPVVKADTPFDRDTILRLAEQPSAHGRGLREGVVVRPIRPRHDMRAGRVVAKFVNPAYLVRRGGTEHN